MFLNTQRQRFGVEKVQRVMDLLAQDLADGKNLSTKSLVYQAFNAKLKYLRIVDDSKRNKEVKLRSLWLLLKTGRRFLIGKHAVSMSGDLGWIDGRTGQVNDYFRSWVDRQFREAGSVEAVDEDGKRELERFPILRKEKP